MRNHRLNYILVGFFVLAMLAAGIGAGVGLSGRTGAHDSYRVVMDNVADIKFGTQVRFEGYPVGQVEAIRPVVTGGVTRFELTVSVEEGFQIPADSVTRIGASTILGAKTVDIQRGASDSALAPGMEIAAAPPADMFAALSGMAGEMGTISRENLRPLLKQVGDLVQSADRLVAQDLSLLLGSVNGLTGDLQRQVPDITGELLSFTRNLNGTVTSVDRILSPQNLESVDQVVGNMEVVSQQFVALSLSLQTTLGRVESMSADLERIVAQNDDKVEASLEDVRYTLNAIARNIDTINHNLVGTTRNMNEFSRLIRQNPGVLLGVAEREGAPVEVSVPRTTRANP